MKTGFFWDEKCFWHAESRYAFTQTVGGYVQPLTSNGLPENPETKRRLKNLIDVTSLSQELDCQSGTAATHTDLLRVHPEDYLTDFKNMSDADGGELGLRAPFGPGGYEIAALSAGLVKTAVWHVLTGKMLMHFHARQVTIVCQIILMDFVLWPISRLLLKRF